MIARTPKTDKQLLTENLWLQYYNDVLYHSGIITEEAYHKMIHRISSRTKTREQKRED